jgi:hypothetical protein
LACRLFDIGGGGDRLAARAAQALKHNPTLLGLRPDGEEPTDGPPSKKSSEQTTFSPVSSPSTWEESGVTFKEALRSTTLWNWKSGLALWNVMNGNGHRRADRDQRISYLGDTNVRRAIRYLSKSVPYTISYPSFSIYHLDQLVVPGTRNFR